MAFRLKSNAQEYVVDSPNRRLIRPPLAEPKMAKSAPISRSSSSASKPPLIKKQAPPDQTNAENFYYVKQMQTKTPLVFILKDGEEIQGTLEWYDKTCLKITREDGPNLLLYKSYIKYMYKK